MLTLFSFIFVYVNRDYFTSNKIKTKTSYICKGLKKSNSIFQWDFVVKLNFVSPKHMLKSSFSMPQNVTYWNRAFRI